MPENVPKILIVAEQPALLKRLKKLFRNGLEIKRQASVDKLLEKVRATRYQIVLLNSTVCQGKEQEVVKALDKISALSPATQVLFLVEPDHIELAMAALKTGSYQYTKLPVSDDELRLLVETALETRPKLHLAAKEARSRDRFEALIGRAEPMQKVYRQIEQAAATEIPVLILGETGTGKDLAAQAIHKLSARRDGPYIPVNLGALPSDLVASELFGHEKGAFTGAMKQHKGKFEQSEEGTIFLDEIDAVAEKVQVSLLRLIEQQKFHRLGGRQPIRSNARLIAASNENLEELVQAGAFRQDLFYRLDVFRIVMPPLRERKGDIAMLITEFLARYNVSFKKQIRRVSPEAMRLLEAYEWPGNVRELKNIMQRAVLVCEGSEILPEHLTSRFRDKVPEQPTVKFEIGTSLEEVEREMVLRALSLAGNNRKRAAELLGISRRAIYNKLRKHNID